VIVIPLTGGRAKVQFATPGQTSTTSQYPLLNESNTVHHLSTIEELVTGWKICSHTFQVKDRSYLDNVVYPILSNIGGIISFRFGIQAGNQTSPADSWRPWEDHVLLYYNAEIMPDSTSGMVITIKTADRLWLLCQRRDLRIHRGNISELAGQIWALNQGLASVIEPTANAGTGNNSTYYQSNSSDYEFITKVLLPRAVNAQGVAGYRLYTKDNVLHFHTQNYQTQTNPVIAYAQGSPGINHLVIEDRSIENSPLGSSMVTTLISDPLLGVDQAIKSSADRLLKFGNNRITTKSTDVLIGHVGPNSLADEVNLNQSTYTYLSSTTLSGHIDIASNVTGLRVGDIITLNVADAGAVKLDTGNWYVAKAVHTIRSSSLSSTFKFTRGEINSPTAAAVQDPESNSARQSIPGIVLTLPPNGNNVPSNPVLDPN
jgi:hypothetical protein